MLIPVQWGGSVSPEATGVTVKPLGGPVVRKWVVWTSAVLVLCLSAGVLLAGEEGEGAKEKRRKEVVARQERGPQAWGKIKSIDVDAKKVVVTVRKRGEKEPVEVTFRITEETKVRLGGEEKALSDLVAGKDVTIAYKAAGEEGGDAVALSITLRMPMAVGKVKSVDVAGGRIVVTVGGGRGQAAADKTFLVNDQTKVRVGRDEKTLADVAADSRVIITYKPGEKDGEGTAISIQVQGERRTTPATRKTDAEE